MKTFTLAAVSTLAIAAMPCAASAAAHPNFRHLQQGGNNLWRPPQNAFPANNNNGNNWQAENAGGSPWNNQGAGASPEAFPQTGGAAVGGGQQVETAEDVQPEGLENTNSTQVPVAGAAPTTEAPAAGAGSAPSTEEPAQATIMVILPDFLAPAYSGSGSTMMIAGMPDSDADKSGATGSAGMGGDGKKSSAMGQSPQVAATVFAVASAVVLSLFF